MSSTTQTIIDGTLDIVRQELAAASAAELDALYAIERAAAIVADSLTRSAAMDQAHRQLRRARLAQTQLTATYLQLLAQLEVTVAPIVETVAAPTTTAEMICNELLQRRTRADGELPTLPQTPEFSDDSHERRSRCYWW